MTYDRKYGKPEGLAERLEDWATRLSSDKSLPWAGLGLMLDLITAARIISGKPQDPEPEAWEIEAKKALEFDL